MARIPVLREPVEQLLDHARFGSFALVLAITFINGIVEELYFRGALYAALPRHQVTITTVSNRMSTPHLRSAGPNPQSPGLRRPQLRHLASFTPTSRPQLGQTTAPKRLRPRRSNISPV